MPTIVTEGQLQTLQRPWRISSGHTASLNLYGDYHVDLATVYRVQPNVRRVVDFLAKNIAQLGLKLYRRTSDTARESLSGHPLQRLIQKPNPYLTRFRYIRGLVSDLAIYDAHYSVKVGQYPNITLQPIPPFNVQILGKSWWRPEGFKIVGAGTELEIPVEQMIYLRGYSPEDNRKGIPSLETLRRILAEESAASDYRENFWKNAARIEGVLQHPGKLTPTAAERLSKDWHNLYSGSGGSGKTAILEEGMQFEKTSFSAKDSEYIASRKLSLEEVAGAYQISPPMIGVLDEANFASLTQFHTMLYQDTLGPWLTWIEEDLELQLIPAFSDVEDTYLEFNIQEKLKGSFEEQSRSMQALVGRPVMTADEGRAKLNLPPMGGNAADIATPLNLMVGVPGATEGGGDNPNAIASEDLTRRIDAATALIRAGFEPAAALQAVNLSPIEHLGLVPITVKPLANIEAEPLTEPLEPSKAYVGIIENHLDRVRSNVVGRQKNSGSIDTDYVFNAKRFDRELTGNLLALGAGTSDERMVKAEQAAKSVNQIILSHLQEGFAKGGTADEAIAAARSAIFNQEASNAA